MNPFLDSIFKEPEFQNAELNKHREEFLKNKDFNVDDLVEWFVTMQPRLENAKDLLTQLYYVYRTKIITDKIGMSKPHTVESVGGYLAEDFYTKLYKQLSKESQNQLFSFMPGNTQNDEMLINYMENPPEKSSGSINNYHGKSLKTSTLEWLIDNRFGSIKEWKPEWWTVELKDKAITKDPFALTLIPEKLLTADEIINVMKEHKDMISKYYNSFWKNIPETFKHNSEIFARWVIAAGGLNIIENLVYKESYYTFENIKKYFELSESNLDNSWNRLTPEWKIKLIDIAIPKAAGAIANDENFELNDKIIDKLLAADMSDVHRAKFAFRLSQDGKLTNEIIDQLHLNWWGLERLPSTYARTLFASNPYIISYLVKHKDSDFLAKKTNWPTNVPLTRDHIIDIIVGLNFNYNNIKARMGLMKTRLVSDDYAFLYLSANEWSGVNKPLIKDLINKIFDNGFGTVEPSIKEFILNFDQDATYEDYVATSQIFFVS